jgi:hypothetical protein
VREQQLRVDILRNDDERATVKERRQRHEYDQQRRIRLRDEDARRGSQ